MDLDPQVVEIEFLYLDLASCGRCVAGDASVREAMSLLSPVLDRVGVTLALRTIHVTGAGQAAALRLVSSPAIRVDGADIAGELAVSGCGDCTDLSAGGAQVECRVWRYRGRHHTETPVGLIIDAVLSRIYGGRPAVMQPAYSGLPVNLGQFFGVQRNAGGA